MAKDAEDRCAEVRVAEIRQRVTLLTERETQVFALVVTGMLNKQIAADLGVDVVSVCICTALHAQVSIFAAEHGKHVLSEKPIALTVADAEAMIAAARHNNVKLAVGLMRRYSPVLPALRDWLAADASGHPALYYAVDAREIRPKREMHDANGNAPYCQIVIAPKLDKFRKHWEAKLKH